MQQEIEQAVTSYEHGQLTRRELVGRLTALAAAMAAAPQARAQPESTFKATGIDHIALHSPDIQVSRDFYVKHLGMEVTRDGDSSCFLSCGNNFLALFRDEKPGLDHYCYSIEHYDVGAVEKKLQAENLSPRRSGNRIYFDDPHGITVQLAAGADRA